MTKRIHEINTTGNLPLGTLIPTDCTDEYPTEAPPSSPTGRVAPNSPEDFLTLSLNYKPGKRMFETIRCEDRISENFPRPYEDCNMLYKLSVIEPYNFRPMINKEGRPVAVLSARLLFNLRIDPRFGDNDNQFEHDLFVFVNHVLFHKRLAYENGKKEEVAQYFGYLKLVLESFAEWAELLETEIISGPPLFVHQARCTLNLVRIAFHWGEKVEITQRWKPSSNLFSDICLYTGRIGLLKYNSTEKVVTISQGPEETKLNLMDYVNIKRIGGRSLEWSG